MLVHDCFIFLMDYTLYFTDMVSLSRMIIIQILYFKSSVRVNVSQDEEVKSGSWEASQDTPAAAWERGDLAWWGVGGHRVSTEI